MKFMIDPFAPQPDPEPPEGGWHVPTCTFESHHWTLEIEYGRVSISCADPCDESLFNPARPGPMCLHDWQPEDYSTPEPIPVKLTYVDDSTPSTPAGPAEYGYYIEIRT